MSGILTTLGMLVRRDLLLAVRLGGGGMMAVVFFALVVTLIPFGVGRENLGMLKTLAPGILWIGVVLASLLTLDRLFQADLEDGSIDTLASGGVSAFSLVIAKCIAHWLTTALPLILAAPMLALLMQFPMSELDALLSALLLGTPALTLIGAIGAALTAGIRRGGLLLALLVLPFAIPTLIFGTAAAASGEAWSAAHQLVAGATLFALVVSPPAAAAALRLNLT